MTGSALFAPPRSLEEILERAEEIKAELGRRDLLGFTRYTYPGYEVNWHHRLVADHLDRALAGQIRRLIILEPPQNGKSEQVSRRFPAFALGRKPHLRIIACSYSMSLAQDMSRDVQKIMSTPQYQKLFPEVRLAESSDAEKRTQGQFDIVGQRGYYYAAGVDGSITGKSSDIGIIDDPIKNRQEAESETYRDRVWEWYKSAFATRQFGDAGVIIICVTRWHEDDLVGRLLELAKSDPEAEQWVVLRLPALLDEPTSYDPRQIGEPLWPSKYPLPELRRRKISLGQYDWSALYQQKPSPPGGGLFKREWFKFCDAAPKIARRARGWDTGATEDGGDYTAGVRIAEADGLFYIEDVVRDQLGPAGVDALIKQTAQFDGAFEVVQREQREGGSSGKTVTEARTKALKGYDYKEVLVTGNKPSFSKPFRAQMEAGNVFMLRGSWNKDFVDELADFPTGKHDDQVDAAATAFNSVLLEPEPQKEATWGR